jgi:hypothetical protein
MALMDLLRHRPWRLGPVRLGHRTRSPSVRGVSRLP